VASRRARLAAALTAAVVLLSGCAAGGGADGHSFSGTEVKNPFRAPAAPALTDTDGASYSLAADTRRPLTLLFFGYTYCPDICTMVMANVASALTRLDEADRDRVEVVFVTTDPSRDDAPRLRAYLDRFDPGITGLTGRLPDLAKVGESFGVFMEKGRALPTGGYDVTHTTHVFAIDADDEVPVTWAQETTPGQLAADVAELLDRA
jgi:protein SCO1/2